MTFSVVLLLALAATQALAYCGGGAFYSNGYCYTCPAGYYCPGDDDYHPCRKGTYSGGSLSSCRDCPAGTGMKEAATSAAECGACQGDTVSAGGEQCHQCSSGAEPSSDHTKCEFVHAICQPGYFAARGEHQCTPCPRGTYTSEAAAFACAQCEPGHFTALSDAADATPATSAARFCVACPAGSACDGAAKTPCEKEHFSPPGYPTCPECPFSSHARRRGMAKCEVGLGEYFRYPGEVVECEEGYYCPGGLAERQQCPPDRPHSPRGVWSESFCSK